VVRCEQSFGVVAATDQHGKVGGAHQGEPAREAGIGRDHMVRIRERGAGRRREQQGATLPDLSAVAQRGDGAESFAERIVLDRVDDLEHGPVVTGIERSGDGSPARPPIGPCVRFGRSVRGGPDQPRRTGAVEEGFGLAQGRSCQGTDRRVVDDIVGVDERHDVAHRGGVGHVE
jgi:hypothetical protein